MKRIFLFLVLNFAIMFALMVIFHLVCYFFDLNPSAMYSATHIDLPSLAAFSLVWGMGGGFISLLLSKSIAKWSVKAYTIDGTEGEAERWLVETVRYLADRANVKMPEVAIYNGSANAFATGAFKNHALIAVSSDIMRQMTREELRAVLGHEMSHVTNGDMVTMTLLQGVLNACVIFLSRVVAFIASRALSNNSRNSKNSNGGIYYLVYYILQFMLGILASLVTLWYSRKREFAADKGSADLLGSPSSMIAALRRLGNLQPGALPNSLKAFGIGGKSTSIFATHPSLEDRIEALERLQRGL